MVYELDEMEVYVPLHGPIRLGWVLQRIDHGLYMRTNAYHQILVSIFRKADVLRSLSPDNLTDQLARVQYSSGTHPNVLMKILIGSGSQQQNLLEGSFLCVSDEMNFYLLMRLAEVEIIASFQERNVALPLEFMKPTINEASCQLLTVLDIHGNAKQSSCLHSDSGQTYELEDRIFKSSAYGCVQRGWVVSYLDDSTYLRTTEPYQIVVKRYSKQMILERVRADNPLTEFAALQYVAGAEQHPHVLGQLECLEDELHYYSVMRFCEGGELTERIDLPPAGGGVSLQRERQIRSLFSQLLDGLEYLQSRGIYHRDLSLENLLLTDNSHLLIIDLGMSLWVPYDTLIQTPHFIPKMDPPKGKKQYVSPEALANTHPFDPFRSDLWSVAVILFVLLSGRFPVQVASPLCPFFRCIAGGGIGQIFRKYNIQISREAMDLLAHMLNVEPALRYSIDQIRAHPWMAGGG
jgi:serine/threonine protein kinase